MINKIKYYLATFLAAATFVTISQTPTESIISDSFEGDGTLNNDIPPTLSSWVFKAMQEKRLIIGDEGEILYRDDSITQPKKLTIMAKNSPTSEDKQYLPYLEYYELKIAKTALSGSNPDKLPDYLKAPEKDIDAGIYNLSDFEQLDTATGRLKLVHHDIHYPGNSGMDINLYRVHVNEGKYTSPKISEPNTKGSYSMTPGFMPFHGTLCHVKDFDRATPYKYIYYDEQRNPHIFSYDEQRYQYHNTVAKEAQRATTFYSDTGWKAICQLSLGHQPMDKVNQESGYYYVKSVGWTLFKPNGNKITLGIDTSSLAFDRDPEIDLPPNLSKFREENAFGNWIQYHWIYSDAFNLLSQITTSDNRTLTFKWLNYKPGYYTGKEKDEYVPGKLINNDHIITDDNGREWQYIGNKAIMPDGRIWEYKSGTHDIIEEVTNPFGGKHRYTYLDSWYPKSSSGGKRYQILSSKTVDDNNGNISTWKYSFTHDKDKYLIAEITEPTGEKSRYIHWGYQTAYWDKYLHSAEPDRMELGCFRDGKLKSVEYFDANNNSLRKVRHEYGVDYRNVFPKKKYFKHGYCRPYTGGFAYPLKTTVTDQGKTYSTAYKYRHPSATFVSNSEQVQRMKDIAWREVRPSQKIESGDIEKTTDYQYFVTDTATCLKKYKSPKAFREHFIREPSNIYTCVSGGTNEVKGKYFSNVQSSQLLGTTQPIETTYDPHHFGVIERNVLGLTTKQTWHNDGNVASITDAAGNTTTFNNYKRGIPQMEVLANGVRIGRNVSGIGAIEKVTTSGRTTRYQHTPIGLLSEIQFPKAGTEKVTANYYFSPDAPRAVIERGDFKQTNYYDGLGRTYKKVFQGGDNDITYLTEYDKKGRTKKTTYANKNTGITYKYDELDRVTEICDQKGCTTRNYLGNQEIVTDANGHSTTYIYHRYGRGLKSELIEIRSPESVTTNIQRDIKGDIESVTQDGLTRSLVYFTDKGLGLKEVHDPERGVLIYERDKAGRVTHEFIKHSQSQQTSPSLDKTINYDVLNRIEQINFIADPKLNKTFEYDDLGQLTRAENGFSNWHYQYDDNGNMTRGKLIAKKYGGIGHKSNEVIMTVNYAYDDMDNIKSITYPSKRQVHYGVNGLGQIKKVYLTDKPVASNTGMMSGKPIVSNASYHPNGALNALVLGNGSTYQIGINEHQLLDKIQVDGGNDVNMKYAYDNVGNVRSITNLAQPNLSKTMTYDDLNRLIQVNSPKWNGGIGYHYDKRSNITMRKELDSSGSPKKSATYNYNPANNRLIDIEYDIDSDKKLFRYDQAGNVISDAYASTKEDMLDNFTYRYNANNQLYISGIPFRPKWHYGGNIYHYDAHDQRFSVLNQAGFEFSQYTSHHYHFYSNGLMLGEYLDKYEEVEPTKSVSCALPIAEYIYIGSQTIAQIDGRKPTKDPNNECPNNPNNSGGGNGGSGGNNGGDNDSGPTIITSDSSCPSGKALITLPDKSTSAYLYLLNHYYGEKKCL